MAMKPVVIKFFAPVIDVTVNALMDAVEQKMKQGTENFIILVSSLSLRLVALFLMA